MSSSIRSAHEDAALPNWRDSRTYSWMTELPKVGWAWEFLRRNAHYRADYRDFLLKGGDVSEVPSPSHWPLLRFQDPDIDARTADILWRREACRSVLPLASAEGSLDPASHALSIASFKCRVATFEQGEIHHVLLAEGGRALQLEVHGPLQGRTLLTPVLPGKFAAPHRVTAIKRLNDLMIHGVLRPHLYPCDRRSPRLMKVVQALDGWLARASHRDIAISVFGTDRVARDWSGGGYLRDQVRRAIGYGRILMESGYRRMLG